MKVEISSIASLLIRNNEIKATSSVTEAGRFSGSILFSGGGQWRPLLQTEGTFDSADDAIQAMNTLIADVRSEAVSPAQSALAG